MTKKVLKTPKERFDALKDYPFDENFANVMGYDIHYVDEGEGPTVLLLHGEPSWSYLYRKMIPLLVQQGFRVVAPDLLGFGKSDKLASRKDYSYQLLVDVKTAFIEELDLEIEVMFMQDWGSLIGFRLMETVGQRIKSVLLSNGAFPSAGGIRGVFGHFLFRLLVKFQGKVTQEELMANTNFQRWVAYTQTVDQFPVSGIIQGATVTELSEEELAAYDAPFPDETYKEGARQLPMLVTSQLKKNRQVWEDVIKTWDKPFLTLFGTGDPITRGNEKKFMAKVPGAQGLDHDLLDKAAHFIQEDQPERLVEGIVYLSELD